MWIQLLINLHHRESFLRVFAPPTHHIQPDNPALLEGSSVGSAVSKAWTQLCSHPFHRGRVLLLGWNCCLLSAACPHTGPISTCAAAGNTPTLLWQPWQCQGEQKPSPAHPTPLPKSPADRKFSSVFSNSHSHSSSCSLSLSASPLSVKPAQLPTALPRTQERGWAAGPTPKAAQVLKAGWFYLYLQREASACAQHTPGRCPFEHGCCSTCPFTCLGSLGSRCRHIMSGSLVLQLTKVSAAWGFGFWHVNSPSAPGNLRGHCLVPAGDIVVLQCWTQHQLSRANCTLDAPCISLFVGISLQ